MIKGDFGICAFWIEIKRWLVYQRFDIYIGDT